jgi:hypothetical protein
LREIQPFHFHPLAYSMKAIASRTNIILVGHWNRMIFTPEWVTRNLFEPKEILVPLLPIDPIRFDGGEFSMEVSFPRLAMTSKTLTDESLRRMEQLSVRILDRLKDTPIKGVGSNFGFDTESATFPKIDVFRSRDLEEMPAPVLANGVSRQLQWGGDRVLNLILALKGPTVHIDLNFHWNGTDSVAAAKTIDCKMVENLHAAQKLLRETYGLEMEEN